MELMIRNADGNLSETDRDYASKKLGKLDRFFDQAQKVEIVHRESKAGLHRVEVTVFADGMTVRGEEQDSSVRAAIDMVSDKLDQRLRRLKRRLHDSYRRRGHNPPRAISEVSPEDEIHEDDGVKIVERKHFLIEPMSVDEAALQLELVNHAFYLFRNEDSHALEVLYKRKDGRYGILKAEI